MLVSNEHEADQNGPQQDRKKRNFESFATMLYLYRLGVITPSQHPGRSHRIVQGPKVGMRTNIIRPYKVDMQIFHDQYGHCNQELPSR